MSDTEAHALTDGIAVIGMAGRFPGARNIDAFWRNLAAGLESISFFTDDDLLASGADPALLKDPNYVKARGILSDADLFDAAFFGFSPKVAELMDPQHRIFLECAWEALENAGYDPARYHGAIGVFGGGTTNTYLLYHLMSNRETLRAFDPMQIDVSNGPDFVATRVSYKLNLKGPSCTVQTACSTSLVAAHMACQSLLNEECDMALAGGVSIHVKHPEGYWYLDGGNVSPDGHCRAFDAMAAGTIFSSGVAAVILKRMEDAITDGDHIHAIIKGSAINNDGALKVGFTAPSVEGQAGVITEALALAGVRADTIRYVVAKRAQMIEELPRGTMLAVLLPEAQVQPWLNGKLSMAAINTAHACVVAGDTDAVAELERQLLGQGVACQRVQTEHAFHSAMMAPIVEPLQALLEQVSLRPPSIPFFSNVTGNWITAAQATDPQYWAIRLR